MCGDGCCSLNTTNSVPVDDTYSAISLGSGEEVYAGQVVTGVNTEFQFKSLVGGANITLTSNADEITIDGNVGLETATNIGAGAQLITNSTVTNVDVRSIVQSTDISVVQNTNDLTITALVPKTRPLIQFYNYMTNPIVDFSSYYQVAPTLSILSTTVVGFPNPTTEGTVLVLTATAFQFTPAPRLDRPVVIFVQLTFNNGSYTTLAIELQPLLTWANDTARDLLLASGVDDVLYQIDNQNSTIKQMVNYDFTPVVLGAGLTALAMNQADNILFFTLSATPTTIQYYDFATKLSGVVTNFNATSGWTPGANISSMTFDQKDCVLYILGDTSAAICRVIHIPPLNRAVGFVFGASPNYNSPFVSVLGNIQRSLAIDRYSKALYGVVDPAASDCQLRTLNFLAGTPSTNSSLTLTGNQSAHCEVGPSSLVYCIDDTSLQMRKTKANRNTNNTTTTFISAIAFRDLTVSPYGILAP